MSRLHRAAVELLSNWRPPSVSQQHLRGDYLRLLADEPEACRRSCHPDHVTSSAIIVSADHRRVALTLHAKLGRWLQTGGHLEPEDDSLTAGALREASEESGLPGLRIDPVPLLLSRHETPCGPLRPAHHLDVQFLVTTTGDEELVRGEESHDLAWFDVDNLPSGVDLTVSQLVDAALARLGAPSRPAGHAPLDR